MTVEVIAAVEREHKGINVTDAPMEHLSAQMAVLLMGTTFYPHFVFPSLNLNVELWIRWMTNY